MVFLVCGAIFSTVADNYWLDIMVFALWYAYLCVTWNIIGGFAGQFSFAHPVFVCLCKKSSGLSGAVNTRTDRDNFGSASRFVRHDRTQN